MSGDASGTRPEEAAILRELDQLRSDFKDHRAETADRFEELITEARRTNGRLRRAELWIAGLKAIGAFLVLLIPFAVAYINSLL